MSKRNSFALGSPNDSREKDNKKNPPKRKKRLKRKNYSQIQVPLSNQFDLLSDDNIDDNTDKEKKKKVEKVTAVVVTDVNKDMNKLITDLNVQCEIKITSVGKKLFPKTADDKQKIITILNAERINYFSHPSDENRTFKLILCGLPEIETKTISDSLTSTYNLTPTKIVMFNTKASSKMYMCHFAQTEKVNEKSVSTIKSVYQHIVTWKKYKPKNKGPTQCYKCSMYGHGIQGCQRFAVCMLCANNHLTKDCKVIAKDTSHPAYKCYNCSSAKLEHNHKANDLNCPFRAKYIATIDKARSKNKAKTESKRITQRTHTNAHSNAGTYVKAPMPSPLTRTFAETASSFNTNQNRRNTAPRVSNNTQTQSNDDLWSIGEVTHLLLTSINELKQCKSKLEQLAVIAKLLQHACE